VANLAATLANNLKQNLTSDLRIGFGSFVDKPLAPFGFLQHPNSTYSNKKGSEGPLPYGFFNHLKLTDDVARFIVRPLNLSLSNIENLLKKR